MSHLPPHPGIIKTIARIVVVLIPAAHDDSESSLVPRGVAVDAAHHRLVDANSCQLALYAAGISQFRWIRLASSLTGEPTDCVA